MEQFAHGKTVTFDRNDPRINAALEARVRKLIRAALIGVPISIPIAWVLLSWLISPVNAALWCGFALFAAAVQWVRIVRFVKPDGFRQALIPAQVLGGLVWGLFPLVATGAEPVLQVVLGAQLLSVLAASALYCAPMRAAYIAFVVPAALVAAASFLLFAEGDARWFAIVILGASGFYCYLAEVNHQSIVRTEVLSRELEHQANTDPLTGLANRKAFASRLQQTADQAVHDDEALGLAYLDLNKFKAINDAHGHTAGDHTLVTIAARLRSALAEDEFAARIGGDEFAVMQGNSSAKRLEAMRATLISVFASPIALDGEQINISCSIGVALVEPGQSISAALRNADSAQYEAKQAQTTHEQAAHDRNRAEQATPISPPAAETVTTYIHF